MAVCSSAVMISISFRVDLLFPRMKFYVHAWAETQMDELLNLTSVLQERSAFQKT